MPSPAPAPADGSAAAAASRSAAPQLGAEQGLVATLNPDPSAALEQTGGGGVAEGAAVRVAVSREARPSAPGLGSGTRMHALGKENVDASGENASSEGGRLGHKPADHAAGKAAPDAALAGVGAGAVGAPDQAQADGQATPVPDQALALGRAAPAPQAAGAEHAAPAGDAPAVTARSQTSSTRGFARLPGKGGARAPAQSRGEHGVRAPAKLPSFNIPAYGCFGRADRMACVHDAPRGAGQDVAGGCSLDDVMIRHARARGLGLHHVSWVGGCVDGAALARELGPLQGRCVRRRAVAAAREHILLLSRRP